MPKILIVGGGYAGFYTAWKLEKHLRKGEAEIVVVDPLPYLTYLPFLPEVAAGSIEPRHTVVSHRRHLKRTKVINAKVTGIDHDSRVATISPNGGEEYDFEYDHIVVTAGSVSRTFPIPGIADNAIGLKSIEEAIAVRDRLIANFEQAASLPKDSELRKRLLTVVVVGGGFAGIETFGELRSAASALLNKFPEITFEETHFHLIEAMGRIMPEVSLPTSEWVLKDLAKRGAYVHLDTQVADATDGVVKTNTGEEYPSDLIIWTAGVMANPQVVGGSDLPREPRGRITTQADLRVVDADGDLIEGAWAAGDVAAVPDKTGGLPDGTCVPNAQHAVRQAKRLAKNLVAVLRGEDTVEYFHKNLGAVAGLGLGTGVFQSGKIALKGFLAWVAHRGYHGLAMPTWERKWRVLWGWWHNLFLGRDQVQLQTSQNPRGFFEEFASRPKPKVEESKPAPVEPKPEPEAEKTDASPAETDAENVDAEKAEAAK
ncbi:MULTISPECIES: NAD(P)/FAD-dependent oxidoreductase [unclassified Microbacterium]|uniref:NAD(P)/FAD-dependent oxidoreductase n=1 Tax=unclassified Microbacterium TaxID=2609290 RepID=UPI00097E7F53|nr:FAD-dependent oxidoreductase [Microbacterium sp. JB110]RCS61862.1 NAD(P)/FAD-dependent oxidoreductase [Microbacterium sp. JB110]SJM66290.1 NADH dehydrogenase [Frigoribacterium sp. JB110]